MTDNGKWSCKVRQILASIQSVKPERGGGANGRLKIHSLSSVAPKGAENLVIIVRKRTKNRTKETKDKKGDIYVG